jgi:hypothetical protein
MAGKEAVRIDLGDADTHRRFAMLKCELRPHNSALLARALQAPMIREGLPIDGTESAWGQGSRPPQIRRIDDPQGPIASRRTDSSASSVNIVIDRYLQGAWCFPAGRASATGVLRFRASISPYRLAHRWDTRAVYCIARPSHKAASNQRTLGWMSGATEMG